eukprot:GHVL01021438.1.p1 GENE.GHVL01021438.1~~GHVL01021438.1.p1  ORF type:complete len:451 (+),score=98.06 GHVL01021438.1:78-1430(+)
MTANTIEYMDAEIDNLLRSDLINSGLQLERYWPLDTFIECLVEPGGSIKRRYGRDVIASVFHSCTLQNNQAKSQDLLEQYTRKRRELITSVKTYRCEVDNQNKLASEALEQLHEAKQNEPVLSDGEIISDSQAIVHLKDTVIPETSLGRNIPEHSEISVHLSCQGQTIETQRREYRNTIVWNEMFAFRVKNTEGELLIRLRGSNRLNNQTWDIGTSSVELRELYDQQKHDKKCDVKGKGGNIRGHILAMMQWIWSRVKLYESHYNKYIGNVDRSKKNLEMAERELTDYNKPFESSHNNFEISEKFSVAIEDAMVAMKLTDTQMVAAVATGIYLFLSSLACFSRPDYINLCLAVLCFYNNIHPSIRWSETSYKTSCFVLLYAIITDIIWLSIFLISWESNTSEGEIHNISKVFTIFELFFKLIYGVFLWKQWHDFKGTGDVKTELLPYATL